MMKYSTMRDKIAKKEGLICFKMEVAGLMDSFQRLVIRSVCGYAYSYKNEIWQLYTAATAGAFASESKRIIMPKYQDSLGDVITQAQCLPSSGHSSANPQALNLRHQCDERYPHSTR